MTLAPSLAPSSPPQGSSSLSLHLSSSLATVSSPGNGWELLWFLQVCLFDHFIIALIFICFLLRYLLGWNLWQAESQKACWRKIRLTIKSKPGLKNLNIAFTVKLLIWTPWPRVTGCFGLLIYVEARAKLTTPYSYTNKNLQENFFWHWANHCSLGYGICVHRSKFFLW